MKIKDIVSQLTLEEKALLLTGSGSMSTAGVERLGIKPINMADGPHGVRKDNDFERNCTTFPCLSALAATWNRECAFMMGKSIANDCIKNDVDMILAPGVNIKRTALCGRNFEYFSEDPILSGEMASEYINGVQSLGVGTSLKHFAVNNQEEDRLFLNAEVDERTLRELYLKAFEIAVKKSRPTSVMCALNKVNAVLCSENKYLLTDILKDEWGFEGFVVSDWGCSKDTGKSVEAGLDLQMPQKSDIIEQTKSALEKGSVTMGKIDASVERVLNFVINHKNAETEYNRDEQHEIAERISEESIVLLKNEDNILPLTSKKYKKIVVIGEYAHNPVINGFGSAQVYTREDYIESPVECMKKLLPDTEIEYIPFYCTDKYYDLRATQMMKEINCVADADAVVMFAGRQRSVEAEAMDITSSALDPYYEFFIKRIYPMNPNIVLVMQTGGAVTPATWQNRVKGIVQMWYGGEAAGSAVANVLCGKANPSGRLSETFPLKSRDNLNYPGDGLKVSYDEKLSVGYRYYDRHPEEIWFPFGHGLSYTKFEYNNIKAENTCDGFTVKLDVKNTGDMAGYEVVQLYVSDRVSTVTRPEKELKDFAKIHLEKGETKTVEFAVSDDQLAYYNTTFKQWITEPGIYDILIGSSSRDIRLKAEYKCTKDCPYTFRYEAEQIVG